MADAPQQATEQKPVAEKVLIAGYEEFLQYIYRLHKRVGDSIQGEIHDGPHFYISISYVKDGVAYSVAIRGHHKNIILSIRDSLLHDNLASEVVHEPPANRYNPTVFMMLTHRQITLNILQIIRFIEDRKKRKKSERSSFLRWAIPVGITVALSSPILPLWFKASNQANEIKAMQDRIDKLEAKVPGPTTRP